MEDFAFVRLKTSSQSRGRSQSDEREAVVESRTGTVESFGAESTERHDLKFVRRRNAMNRAEGTNDNGETTCSRTLMMSDRARSVSLRSHVDCLLCLGGSTETDSIYT